MKKGFTLAEVLITLVIIGVIAAITIPSLINKTNEQETVTAVKKAYSVLNQGLNKAKIENGEIDTWVDENSPTLLTDFTDKLKPHFSVLQYHTDMKDCFANNSKYMNDESFISLWQGRPAFSLADGSLVTFWFGVPRCNFEDGSSENLKNACGDLVVDINGQKGPNTIGKDMFSFVITKNGVTPSGLPSAIEANGRSINNCGKNSQGMGCTAWVIAKGNMDYLRKDISW